MSAERDLHDLKTKLEKVLVDLDDRKRWTWTRVISLDDAANTFMHLLADNGIVDEASHPMTIGAPCVWRFDGKFYGRTDGVTDALFERKACRKEGGG